MGCGGGSEASPRPPQSASPEFVPRAGPAKVTEVAEKCAFVAEDQWRGVGVDQPPRQSDWNGTPGCEYQLSGDAGWSVFVGVSGERSYKAEVNRRAEPTGGADLKGYPGKTFRNGADCTLIADISDLGFLVANGKTAGSDEDGVDPCVLAEQFGGMAVMNLPDAPVPAAG
ncbi:DUF3558 family protein [Saccharopolyspora sp. NPDC049426]|uniref:DUF3558 family protein n=1 Tax=Saccharopolyspora sp. NPDC049426 TaxID=3155652 RepID=UPI00343CE00B